MSLSRNAKNPMLSLINLLVVVIMMMMTTTIQLPRSVSSFQPASSSSSLRLLLPQTTVSTTALSVFGSKKSKKMTAEEMEKYWQGEWVCKDCGYIYNRAECAGMFFEEQGPGFRCPQCSGPRRRYAKKVGDRVGTTLDGGDAPILIFSFGGVLLTIAFGIWAVNNL